MPHVLVKLWPGKSDDLKAQLTEAIVRDVTTILGSSPQSISVGFEEVPSEEWTERVYEPDILDKWDALTKEPGYGPGPSRSKDRPV